MICINRSFRISIINQPSDFIHGKSVMFSAFLGFLNSWPKTHPILGTKPPRKSHPPRSETGSTSSGDGTVTSLLRTITPEIIHLVDLTERYDMVPWHGTWYVVPVNGRVKTAWFENNMGKNYPKMEGRWWRSSWIYGEMFTKSIWGLLEMERLGNKMWKKSRELMFFLLVGTLFVFSKREISNDDAEWTPPHEMSYPNPQGRSVTCNSKEVTTPP